MVTLRRFFVIPLALLLMAVPSSEGDEVDELISRLSDKDADVRFEAARQLAVKRDPRAVGPLIDALGTHPESSLCKRAAKLLGELRDGPAIRRGIMFVDYSSPEKPQAYATLDCKRREFIDENLFVWSYGEKADQPIRKSSKPVESYPDWATPELGYAIARPHESEPGRSETGETDKFQQ